MIWMDDANHVQLLVSIFEVVYILECNFYTCSTILPVLNIYHLPTVAPVLCSLCLHHNQLIVRWFGMCTGPRLLGESILRV